MKLQHLAHFKQDGKPKEVIDFMNFTDKPKEPTLTQKQAFARIDREVFGL